MDTKMNPHGAIMYAKELRSAGISYSTIGLKLMENGVSGAGTISIAQTVYEQEMALAGRGDDSVSLYYRNKLWIMKNSL
jgi:hypothetical protein